MFSVLLILQLSPCKSKARRDVASADAPLLVSVRSEAIKCAWRHIIACIRDIKLVRVGVDRYAVWHLYLLLRSVGDEAISNHLSCASVDDAVSNIPRRSQITELRAIDEERVTRYGHPRIRNIK